MKMKKYTSFMLKQVISKMKLEDVNVRRLCKKNKKIHNEYVESKQTNN